MADNKTLQEKLDAITFKNDQVQKIKAVQEGKQRLKDSLGRNKQRTTAATPTLQGLQTIKNTLGRQNMKSLDTTP
jgi:hypothetical protein